jgi:hypothetical protein
MSYIFQSNMSFTDILSRFRDPSSFFAFVLSSSSFTIQASFERRQRNTSRIDALSKTSYVFSEMLAGLRTIARLENILVGRESVRDL